MYPLLGGRQKCTLERGRLKKQFSWGWGKEWGDSTRTPTLHSPAQTPQGKAEATVGVEADGDLPGGVQLTLQLDGAAQGTGGCVRHLKE